MHLHRAVNDAEATCGLQFCVVVGSGDGSPTSEAHRALDELGVTARPAVLVAVRSVDGAIEVELGPTAGTRLRDVDIADVFALCPRVADEDVSKRAAAIVLTLADKAGPGLPDPEAPELPDVVRV